MKPYITALLCTTILLTSCVKRVDTDTSVSMTVADDGREVILPCKTVSFTTNYTAQVGMVPPFKYSKTLYSNGRVASINMLGKFTPNYFTYKQLAFEWIGKFTYKDSVYFSEGWPPINQATFVGTAQIWEYYKSSTGLTARRSIRKTNKNLTISFSPTHGYVFFIRDNTLNKTVLNIGYGGTQYVDDGRFGEKMDVIWVYEAAEDVQYNKNPIIKGGSNPENRIAKEYNVKYDSYGNILMYAPNTYFSSLKYIPRISYTYDYTQAKGTKKVSYQPSQLWVSQEFSLCEAMQWIMPPRYLRKSLSAEFYPYNNSTKIVQTRSFKNYKFDATGNMISHTYEDNVLQKTTWFCK